MALSLAQQLQQLYIGYLGRAADKTGLEYWVNDIGVGNITLEQVRSNFVHEQPEYAQVYGGLDRGQLVAKIYENLFERQFDQVGYDYWVTGGGSTVNADQLIVAFLNAADPNDRQVLDNKLQIAQGYTEIAGYDHEHVDKSSAASIIADVDGTAATVDSASRILLTTKQYLDDPSTPSDARLLGIMQSEPGAAETLTVTGRIGQPDVFWINADNFDSNGDHIQLTNFEIGDALFLGEGYTHRPNTAPTAGNNGVLEMFLQQQGDNVLMSAETDATGSGFLQITVMGVTVAEMVPTTV